MSGVNLESSPTTGYVVDALAREAGREVVADPLRGTLRRTSGERVIRLQEDFFDGLTQVLARDATGVPSQSSTRDFLYRMGLEWGAQEIESLRSRLEQELGATLDELPCAVVLEHAWWPLRTGGFGALEYDLTRGDQGWIVLRVREGLMHEDDARGVVHVYEGIFAALFSALAKRELHAACIGQGLTNDGPAIHFVVATESRVERARELQAEGDDFAEILREGETEHDA